jgi:serine/threonine protein kinase
MSTSELPTLRQTQRSTQPQPSKTAPRRSQKAIVLDRYHLLRRLGAGGYGIVWEARDQRLERAVAIKIVPRERILKGRFEREARAAARLSHPGIVTLYEAAVDEDDAYLVSELVHGQTLRVLLDAGRLSDQDIVGIAISLCDALAHAHQQGVVHRDVKPSNVLVPEPPHSTMHLAKLTDFGVARVIGGDSLTRTGEVVGTAAYMAPEQAEGLESGAAVDLYALALITYEALTGINPVRTGTAAMRARRLGAHLPALRRQRRDLPHELGRGIDLALRPRPRERGSIEDLRASLRAVLPQLGDDPGVVEHGWVARAARANGPHLPSDHDDPDPVRTEDHEDEQAPQEPSWPTRGLAALAAGAGIAWIAHHLLAPIPVPSAALALTAAIAVLVLPRIAWLSLSAAVVAVATAQQKPGAALVLALGAVIPVALMPRRGTNWPLSLGAPALAAIGLAGAWPALAATLGRTTWSRAMLALTGWLWLALAGPLVGHGLYTQLPTGIPPPAVWTASLNTALSDVLAPMLRTGIPVAAAVWPIAAITLPWLLRTRSLRFGVVLSLAWAGLTLGATELALATLHSGETARTNRSVALGALAAAAVALGPCLLRAWQNRGQWQGSRPKLA